MTRHEPSQGIGTQWVIIACFFLSGATGLLYQVVWLRMLGLVFGHTVYAITTVLAAFMSGLALGSLVFGRLSGRLRSLIAVYGWLEIGIGLYCVLIPLLLRTTERLYLPWARALELSYDAFNVVQFALGFLLLLIPTTLMGGTLPVLSQGLVTHQRTLARKIGVLYAANAFGAVVGAGLAGYFVLPALGIQATVAIAATANLLVGALAIAVARRMPVASAFVEPPSDEERAAVTATQEVSRTAALVALGAIGVSGAVSMVYEVVWTRALALVIGSSTYAFTSMLLAFLVGIAGGSALFSWMRRRPASLGTFAALQGGIAVAAAVAMAFFDRMPELFVAAVARSSSLGSVQLLQFALSAVVLLPSTLLIGATFPCVIALVGRVDRVGAEVGRVYAVNTMGAIVGTLLGGFVLLPRLGVHAAIKAGILTNLALMVVLVLASRRGSGWRGASVVGAAAAALVVVLLPGWDQSVMTSGAAVYAKRYLQDEEGRTVSEILHSRPVVFYRDGVSGTIAVHKDGEHVTLSTNGKVDAGAGDDMVTQLALGHLPMLLHPNPKRVLVIGLGSGVTAGAVARHPIDRLDVVEIEPAVVEASPFFAAEHGHVLDDPRVRLVIADARNFLLTSTERYDVIISEPSNPWISGLASLFSTEFFALAREHLAPDGIMVQWVQGYNIYADDLRMIIRTFRTSFPATTVWNSLPADMLLVGRADATPFDVTTIRERFPNAAPSLARFGVHDWAAILGYFTLGADDTARFAGAGALNDDDRLPLEFSAPRALYTETTMENWETMHGFRTATTPSVTPRSLAVIDQPEVRYRIGFAYFQRRILQDALAEFERTLELRSEPPPGDARHRCDRDAVQRSHEGLGRGAARARHRSPEPRGPLSRRPGGRRARAARRGVGLSPASRGARARQHVLPRRAHAPGGRAALTIRAGAHGAGFGDRAVLGDQPSSFEAL